ncbi:hypothetical protein FQZ97_606240 [compost metagenome]
MTRGQGHGIERHVALGYRAAFGDPAGSQASAELRNGYVALQAGQHAHTQRAGEQAVTQRADVLVCAVVRAHQVSGAGGGVGASLQGAHRHEDALGLATGAALGFLCILGLGAVQAAAFHLGTDHLHHGHGAGQAVEVGGGIVGDRRTSRTTLGIGQELGALDLGGQGAFFSLQGVELFGLVGGQVTASCGGNVNQVFHRGDLGGALLAELVQLHVE